VPPRKRRYSHGPKEGDDLYTSPSGWAEPERVSRSPAAILRSNSPSALLPQPRRKLSSSASANGKIDLRPHCDRSPFVVNELLSLRRVFRLFSSMGLRHLVVVDARSCVVGMITRKDFLKHTSYTDVQRLVSARREESRMRYVEDGERELSGGLHTPKPTRPAAVSDVTLVTKTAARAVAATVEIA